MKLKSKYLLFAAIPAVGLCEVGTSYAQDANAGALGEIVVTAQKRSENLQNVPIPITAIEGVTAEKLGLKGTTDLAFSTPGLVMHRQTNTVQPSLRGITQTNAAVGDESPIAIYVDNVYYASMTAGLLSFNNIDRVEVLKGPQGTLFGRNAVGGVISIVTRKPSQDPSVTAHIGYGDYHTYEGDFYGTTGLGKGVATDLAVYFRHQGNGFGTELTTGHDSFRSRDFAIRNKWLLTPTDTTTITIAGDYSTGQDPIGLAKDALPGTTKRFPALGTHVGGFFDTQDTTDVYSRFKQWGVSGELDQDFDWARFVSISAYRGTSPRFLTDSDASPGNYSLLAARYDTRQITQELQLLSPSSSRVKWIAGFFYLNNRAHADLVATGSNSAPPPETFRHTVSTLNTRSYAGFGEITVPLGEATNVIAGLRYTSDKQSIVGSVVDNFGIFTTVPQDKSATFSKLTYRLSIDHRFTRNFMVYASYNRGFKSGVFSATSPGDPAVKPSVLDAYQAGFKSEWFDGKMRLNGSAYWYDYKNIQLTAIETSVTRLYNAAAGRIKGVDLDFEVIPVEHLRVGAAVAYVHAQYTNFPGAPGAQLRVDPISGRPTGGYNTITVDASGYQMIYTPKWSWSSNAVYDIPTRVGKFDIAGNVYYNGGYFPDTANQFFQKHYYLVNTSLGWTSNDDKWSAKLWAKNLNDAHYYTHVAFGSSFISGSPMPPRTFGVTLGFKWGGK